MDANFDLDQDLINAVAGIVEASCSTKKMEKEELHPNQKVLDKNKNGKLDADDFKKLRKEEVELDEAADLDALRKEYKKNESDNKHTENAALLAKHFGTKSDQNKVAKAKAFRDQNRGYGSDPLSRHHSKMAHEVHSKLYDKLHGGVNEEVEELDELSKTTLGSYVKKASNSLSKASHDLGDKRAQSAEVDRFTNRHMGDKFRVQGKMKDDLGIGNKAQEKDLNTVLKRTRGITKAANKLTKEQVEEIEALAEKHGLGE